MQMGAADGRARTWRGSTRRCESANASSSMTMDGEFQMSHTAIFEALVVHTVAPGTRRRDVSTAARISRDHFDGSVCAARRAAHKRADTGSTNEACRTAPHLGRGL